MGFVLFLTAAMLFFLMVVMLCWGIFAAHAEAADVPQDPLEELQKTTIVPKDRIVITYMDPDYNMISFRGQGEELGEHYTLGDYYYLYSEFDRHLGIKKEKVKTTPGDLGTAGTNASKPYVMASVGGTVLRDVSADEGITFYGSDTFRNVPTGVLCNAYLTRKDDRGEDTSIWLELTGQESRTDQDVRIGRVDLTAIGAPEPADRYHYNGSTQYELTPTLDQNVATDLVASDWNGDGYSDYILSYMHNPEGNRNYPINGMQVALLYVDGKSLYERISTGTGRVLYTADTSVRCSNWEMVRTYGDTVKPASSLRTAIGDVDGDGADELGLVFTRAGGEEKDDDNGVYVFDVAWDGSKATFTKLYSANSGVGSSYLQNDSVGIAIGNLDGDAGGTAEVCVLHGKSPERDEASVIYLDIYQYGYDDGTNKMRKIVSGVKLAESYKIRDHPSEGYSVAPIEAVADDLDNDGRDELAWLATYTRLNHTGTGLALYVHEWSEEGVSGKGTMAEYDTYQLGIALLTEKYLKFSMTAGVFDYPTGETVVQTPRQIAIARMSSSSGDEADLEWHTYRWNADDGLTLTGKGSLWNFQKADNVAPKIVAANLDNEGLVLGEPTAITVTDNLELVVAMQAPPKHWDIVSGDFNGNMDADGNSVVDVFANLSGYNTTFNSENSSQTMTVTGTSENFSIGGSLGFTVAMTFPAKDAVPLFSVAGEYTYDSVEESTASETHTATLTQMTAAQKDDQLYYTANDYTIWRYPVLYPEGERTEVVSADEDDETADENGNVTVQTYVQYVVPEKIGSSGLSTPGREVSWYEPAHDTLNLFTYPRDIASIQNYPKGPGAKDENDPWRDLDGISLAEMKEQVIGNPDVTSVNLTIREDLSDSELESVSHTVGGNMSGGIPLGFVPPTGGIGKVLSINLAADKSFQSSVTTTTNSTQMNGATINWPGVDAYANRGGFNTTDQTFRSDFAIFTQDAGSYNVSYAVRQLMNANSKIWGAKSPYNQTPDPGFVLPFRFTYEREINTMPDALTVRGLTFDAGTYTFDKAGAEGRALPMSTDVTGTVRVVNYSFKDTEDFQLEVSYQPAAISATGYIDDPDASRATPVGTANVPFIYGREQSQTEDNWRDVAFKWTTGKAMELGYLHFKIVYGDKELSAANNRGYALVGVYDPEDMEALEDIYESAALRASGVRAAGIDADLFIKSVTVRDADGKEMAGHDALPVDQAMEIECIVGLASKGGSPRIKGLPLVRALFLANDGVAGGKFTPLLPMGNDWVFKFNYEPSIHQNLANLRELRLVATSPFLPFDGDADSSNNTYRMSFARDDSSGGGCNAAGAVPAIFAALAACLAVAKKRSKNRGC